MTASPVPTFGSSLEYEPTPRSRSTTGQTSLDGSSLFSHGSAPDSPASSTLHLTSSPSPTMRYKAPTGLMASPIL